MRITGSKIRDFIFCRRFFFLRYIEGYDISKNPVVSVGRMFHEKEYEIFLKNANCKGSIDYFLTKSVEEGKLFILKEVPIELGELAGIADILVISPSNVCIIENKLYGCSAPWNRAQCLFYSYLFHRKYKFSQQLSVGIRSIKEGRVVWMKDVSDVDFKKIEELIEKVKKFIDMKKLPKRRRSPKCRLCPLREVCSRYPRA